ncbi:hypothetical protein L596_011289 [Steinernema carpocapsae]|uniref:legumain n=1 Tax=Steinernema carpocapsae TaxID=34508 RepID=A0A4U5NTE5_STECR|nr:hypothetical protein L596_011289 [Steinernema carpocapsae]
MGPSLGEIVAACVLFFFVLAALATLLILCEECDASEQKRSADLRKRKDVAANWALLVAGSKSWENYRHQADVAHAYHLLRKNGIPAEKIVTMMFDDIANDPQNPNPGTLFNDRTGRNFYEGLVVDYRGNDVNSETFLRVLAGEGKGKVIRSGPNDNIFLFYADHGGIGILSMPVGRLFTRSDLIFNLKAKKEAGGYRRLVVYLESCEGGSMFQDFPKNLDVYAMTASNSFESSYAVLCSEYLPCLADEFSLNWMTDSEMKGIFNRQIQEQFKNAKQHTVASHVSEYGNFEIRNDQIAEFQGSLKEKQNVVSRLRPLKNGCPNDVTNYKRLRIQDIALEMQRRNRSRVIEIEQVQISKCD